MNRNAGVHEAARDDDDASSRLLASLSLLLMILMSPLAPLKRVGHSASKQYPAGLALDPLLLPNRGMSPPLILSCRALRQKSRGLAKMAARDTQNSAPTGQLRAVQGSDGKIRLSRAHEQPFLPSAMGTNAARCTLPLFFLLWSAILALRLPLPLSLPSPLPLLLLLSAAAALADHRWAMGCNVRGSLASCSPKWPKPMKWSKPSPLC